MKAQQIPIVPEKLPLQNLDFLRLVPLADKALKKLEKLNDLFLHLDSFQKKELQSLEIKYSKNLSPEVFACLESNKINLKSLCLLHGYTIPLQATDEKKEYLGKIRNAQNWIGPVGKGIEKAYFLPPNVEDMKRGLDNWLWWLQSNNEHQLIALAVLFAQFLILHPFMDGNGRVARLFVSMYLNEKKITPCACFFMSHYFRMHRLEYFQRLYQVSRRKSWRLWILFFFKGIVSESIWIETQLKKCRLITKKTK